MLVPYSNLSGLPFTVGGDTPSGTVVDITENLADLYDLCPVLLGIDWACDGLISNTFIATGELIGVGLFFAETQTFAAGRGQSQWRGQMQLRDPSTLHLHAETSAAVHVGIVAWGIFTPWPGN